MAENSKISYQKLNAELEQILTKLQDGTLDIDEALLSYQKGLELVEALEKYLKLTSNKVTKLKSELMTATDK